ncbi:DUF4384 domain-containing protein [Geomonas sp. RF6]|uniref:DUF4384 domain-containing protein n=1 Tax=Geomonas sp. RF6 TaxID=2897342 RepID=UPI001E5A7CB9|nr:DUF4384 domain-containing protein [Geomonas sp. RF6]UFS71717.1 DUF4384 domain-containing protein [Geomonas sp. RF6]
MNTMILLVALLLLPPLARAATEPVWVEAVGESIGSEYDPPKEVMDRARNDAKRKAVEEAVGSFLRSHTLVSDAQLAEELTFARVRGTIDTVRIISEERDGANPNLFRVRLKALVRPVLPKEGEGLDLKLSVDRSVLKEGEEVKIYYQSNRDCYVYLFSIAADNSVTLLFPNSEMKDNFVKADAGMVFPPEASSLRLRPLRLPGSKGTVQEKVKLVATKKKEIILTGFQEGMFQVHDASSTPLVGDLARRLNQLDPAEWGDAVAAYTIVD